MLASGLSRPRRNARRPAFTRLSRLCTGALLAGLASLAGAGTAAAQAEAPPSTRLIYPHDTGWVENTGTTPAVVISFPVVVQGAGWMRLEFSRVDLAGDLRDGSASILRVTSLYDAAVQEQNELHVEQWQRSSAYFNGDSVLVEVLAQPGSGPNRVVLEAVTVGLVPVGVDTQCGPVDQRMPSTDARVARIVPVGCTGWIIDDCNSCFLTAGHCTFAASVVQFNVPLSNSNGTIVNPPPSDQYAIDPTSMNSNGGGTGIGDDWAYFGAFANSNTGLTPFQAQGQRFSLRPPPLFNPGHQIRITGFGTDNTPLTRNQTQQTDTGPWVTLAGTTLQYRTDTQGGNSGSPVIHAPSGDAIGIHTHGGCQTNGQGQNSGTGSGHPALQAALASPGGVCRGRIRPYRLPDAVSVQAPTPVSFELVGLNTTGSALVHYRMNGGNYLTSPMTSIGGGLYTGSLPAAACSDTPEYYFSLTSANCGTLTSPTNAPTTVYSGLVGEAQKTHHDDFELRGNWSIINQGNTAGSWEQGVPINDTGSLYDPIADADGSGQCWVTGNSSLEDVDGGGTQLFSPIFDMGLGEVLIRYDYYLGLSAPGQDRMDVEITSNWSTGPWILIATHDTDGANAWRPHSISSRDLSAFGVAQTDRMRMRFTVWDNNPDDTVEGGLDAFSISRVLCSEAGSNYCTPGITTNGCRPLLSATGSPSAAAASGFVVTVRDVEGQKQGILFYSLAGPKASPWGAGSTSFLCVRAPTQRMGALNSGGTSGACDGVLSADWRAFLAGKPSALGNPLVPGIEVFVQGWFRDPPAPKTTNLSDGLRFTTVP